MWMFRILLLFIFLQLTTESWNITTEGFLLNSLRYSRIRNTDYFSIVFSTKEQNGIILYCVGNQSFLLLELYHAVIRLSVKYIGQIKKEPYEGYIGSGLSDNNPHQIEIFREPYSIMLVLDRGTRRRLASWPVISQTPLMFKVNQAFIGGYSEINRLNRFMTLSRTGFSGCIDKAVWNNVNLLYDPFANSSVSFCDRQYFSPLSFISPESYIILNRNNKSNGLIINFDLMIYLNFSTIIFHNDSISTLNISIVDGSFFMSLDFESVNYINAYLPTVKINDGEWHRIIIQLPGKNSMEEPIVVFGVDKEIVTTVSYFSYDTYTDIMFGGYGFIGCVKNLTVDGISVTLSSHKNNDVKRNGCLFPDQCVPNPCQHSGFCRLEPKSFSCLCPYSYPGEVCDDSKYYMSCANMWSCGIKNGGKQFIDLDGIGPYDPVGVLCNNMEDAFSNTVVTQVDNLLPNGKITLKNEPTTISIPYALSLEQLRLLTMNSDTCSQQITYECSFSRITWGNTTQLVWIGGDGEVHHYWNQQNVYGKCQCALDPQKCYHGEDCNCDNDDRVTRTDSVIFTNNLKLPIVGITAMDISSASGKSATIEIGPLLCAGIDTTRNRVTFQETFTYLPLNDINFANPGTIKFQFKTDTARGNVMIFAQGRPNTEYYVLELTNSTTVTAYFSMGLKKYVLAVTKTHDLFPFDNLKFHRLFFKINIQEAFLKVDAFSKSLKLDYNFEQPVQVNKDNTPFFIAGSPYAQFSGYKGVMMKLFINGQLIDFPHVVTENNLLQTGVFPGSLSSCQFLPNPCNFGDCIEHFNYYLCDCSYSPYNGKNCENEVGVHFSPPSSSLTYYFTNLNNVEEYTFSVAFKTNYNGLLYLIQGADKNIFIMLDLYRDGLRLRLNFWKQRTKIPNTFMFQSRHGTNKLTDGLTHVVQLNYQENKFTMYIDGVANYFSIPVSNKDDLIIRNPRWVYLGSPHPIMDYGSVTSNIFNGCMGGMKLRLKYKDQQDIEVIDVLKAAGGSSNSKVVGQSVALGVCVGNLSSPPPPKLLDLPLNMIPGGGGTNVESGIDTSTGQPISITESWVPVIVAILILLAFMLILGSLLFLRWFRRNHGVYVTQEGLKIKKEAEKVQTKERTMKQTALPQASLDDIEGWYL